MPRHPPSRAWLLLLVFAGPVRLAAQASPFLPTDDPRMPLIEHLIARGAVRDPAPLERPFRTSDIARALRESSRDIARRLAAELAPAPENSWGSVGVKAGPQAYSQGRRDLLQGGGDGNVGGYAEWHAEAVTGPVVFTGRVALDTRLSDDPDYPARGFLFSSRNARIVDLYLGLQGSWGGVHVGQMARNWGPVGIPGVPLSDAAHPRPDVGLTLGRGAIRFSTVATRLRSDPQGGSGTDIERYFMAHRLSVHLGGGLTIAAWEVGVIAGAKDELDGTTRAVVPLLVIPALVASRKHRNEMVGGDFSWRPSPRLRIEAQLAIDDWNFDTNNPYPQRWAGSVRGPAPSAVPGRGEPATPPRRAWRSGP